MTGGSHLAPNDIEWVRVALPGALPRLYPTPSQSPNPIAATTTMAASTSGEVADGEPKHPPPPPRHSTARVAHIVRSYLDIRNSDTTTTTTSKKRRNLAKNRDKNQDSAAAAAGEEEEEEGAGDLATANRKCGCEKDGAKVPPVSNPGQSRLLRELGIRVSRYTHEERRDIILRYMQKRSGRQSVNRSASKIPSRQALAERRQRGVGGKFLSKEETQTANKPEEKAEEEPALPPEVIANAGGVPIVGMVFENEEKAYEYYVNYAGNVGFGVRKGWWDKTAKNVTRSRVYVCSREGFRPNNEAKRPRPETRTGCPARMAMKVTSSGKYRIMEFVQDHNHQLAAPFDIEMLKSQRVLAKVQPGSHQNASSIPPGYKNYLWTKCANDMNAGDLRALLDYFQSAKSDNPSFYYAIQVDENDQATNVFWADARSIMDYHYFCDVICFDMTYKVNDYGRPLALFLGMNHHKQMVIFGAALLYDETIESFKWILETFKSAMCGKQPKIILTDRSAALKEALALAWPGTINRSCVWQIYQNAVKSLAHVLEASQEFAHDFSSCIFDLEDEQEFVATWGAILEKYNLKENEWLDKLYKERENWALPYGRQIFSGDIKSTLRAEISEILGIRLKEHLNSEKDLSSFLKFFEALMEKRRQEEIQADYQANHGTPRIPPLRLLWQAASLYTPVIFDLFRKEYELFMECMAYSCGEYGTLSEYMITVKNKTKEQLVRFDSSDGTVACTCRKFENVGILCCHILKVYDLRNVKEIPPQYFLKRWRKDAKLGTVGENNGFTFDSDLKSSVPERYGALCRVFYQIAAKAAENMETSTLMASQSDQLLEQVDRILQTTLADKSSVSHSMKDQLGKMVQSDCLVNCSNEAHKSIGKRKNEVTLRRKNDLETNKRPKARKDLAHSNEAMAVPRDEELHITPESMQSQPRTTSNQFIVPNQLMQGHYILGHNFGLGTSQNLHSNLNQFGQGSPVSSLQQQPYPGNGQLTRGYPPDMQALQFVGTNPQLDHQNSDQGHCAIPVWDFL